MFSGFLLLLLMLVYMCMRIYGPVRMLYAVQYINDHNRFTLDLLKFNTLIIQHPYGHWLQFTQTFYIKVFYFLAAGMSHGMAVAYSYYFEAIAIFANYIGIYGFAAVIVIANTALL